MPLGLEVECWYRDSEGNQWPFQRSQISISPTTTTGSTAISAGQQQRGIVRGTEVQLQGRERGEEKDRLVRHQESRNLRELFRARFEQERTRHRHRQPRVRTRRTRELDVEEQQHRERIVHGPHQQEVQQEEEFDYDEKMPRGQRYEAVRISPLHSTLITTYLLLIILTLCISTADISCPTQRSRSVPNPQ